MTRDHFLVIGLVALLLGLVLACTTPAAAPTKTAPATTIPTKPAALATSAPLATRAPSPTPIAWSATVAELAKLPAKVTTASEFSGGTAKDALKRPVGEAVVLTGRVYEYSEAGGRSYLALDTTESVFASDPALVIGVPLQSAPDRRRAIEVQGRLVGKVTAADRFGVATEMPVVLAQRIGQE